MKLSYRGKNKQPQIAATRMINNNNNHHIVKRTDELSVSISASLLFVAKAERHEHTKHHIGEKIRFWINEKWRRSGQRSDLAFVPVSPEFLCHIRYKLHAHRLHQKRNPHKLPGSETGEMTRNWLISSELRANSIVYAVSMLSVPIWTHFRCSHGIVFGVLIRAALARYVTCSSNGFLMHKMSCQTDILHTEMVWLHACPVRRRAHTHAHLTTLHFSYTLTPRQTFFSMDTMTTATEIATTTEKVRHLKWAKWRHRSRFKWAPLSIHHCNKLVFK